MRNSAPLGVLDPLDIDMFTYQNSLHVVHFTFCNLQSNVYLPATTSGCLQFFSWLFYSWIFSMSTFRSINNDDSVIDVAYKENLFH